jgi:hypothetical protein
MPPPLPEAELPTRVLSFNTKVSKLGKSPKLVMPPPLCAAELLTNVLLLTVSELSE